MRTCGSSWSRTENGFSGWAIWAPMGWASRSASCASIRLAPVTLVGLYAAASTTNNRLSDEKILFHGAGEAAMGIGDLIVSAMTSEGLSKAEALSRCWFMDSKGLVEHGRKDLQDHKKLFA